MIHFIKKNNTCLLFMIFSMLYLGCQEYNVEGAWKYDIHQEKYNEGVFHESPYPIVEISDEKLNFLYGLHRQNIFNLDYKVNRNKLYLNKKIYYIEAITEDKFLLKNNKDTIVFFQKLRPLKRILSIKYTLEYEYDTTEIIINSNEASTIKKNNINLFKGEISDTYLDYTESLFNQINKNLLDSTYFEKNTFSHSSIHTIEITTIEEEKIRIKTYSVYDDRLPIVIKNFVLNMNYYSNLYSLNLL